VGVIITPQKRATIRRMMAGFYTITYIGTHPYICNISWKKVPKRRGSPTEKASFYEIWPKYTVVESNYRPFMWVTKTVEYYQVGTGT